MNVVKSAVLGLAVALAFATPSLAALKVGAKAPDFTAQAWLAGKPFTFDLSDALKKGPVVVYFFPAAHTSGCNVEAHLFSEAIDKFKAQHATVIGVTAGNTDELAEFSKETEHCGDREFAAAYSDLKPERHVQEMLAGVKALRK
jgi:peroxiredoxin